MSRSGLIPSCALLLTIFAIAPAARAYIIVPYLIPSIEFTVENFDTILLGKITEVQPVGDLQTTRLTIRVVKPLRGTPRETIQITVNADHDWALCKLRGGEVILCLNPRSMSHFVRRSFYTSSAGVTFAKHSGQAADSVFIYNLTLPHSHTFSMSKRVKEPSEIIDAITAALAYAAKNPGDPHRMPVTVPLHDLGIADPSDSLTSQLALPADPRIAPLVREWAASAEPRTRQVALSAINAYRCPGWEQIVQSLLNDPATEIIRADFWAREVHLRAVDRYYIREEALALLPLPRPVIITRASHMAYTTIGWRLALLGCFGLLCAVLVAWRVRSRRFGVALLTLSLLLLAGTLHLWWRSRTRADSATFAANGIEHEVTSLRGRIAWLRVNDRAAARSFMVRSQPVHGDEPAWYSRLLTAKTESRHLDHLAATGTTVVGHPGDPSYAYHLLEIPHWSFVIVFCLWPALFTMGSVVARLRRRHRRHWGRCSACGYDLRGNPRTPACPECGSPNPRARPVDSPAPAHAPVE